MNFLVAAVSFLLGGLTVIVLEVYKVVSFFDGIREFLRMLAG